jgi:hypothetical protein
VLCLGHPEGGQPVPHPTSKTNDSLGPFGDTAAVSGRFGWVLGSGAELAIVSFTCLQTAMPGSRPGNRAYPGPRDPGKSLRDHRRTSTSSARVCSKPQCGRVASASHALERWPDLRKDKINSAPECSIGVLPSGALGGPREPRKRVGFEIVVRVAKQMSPGDQI